METSNKQNLHVEIVTSLSDFQLLAPEWAKLEDHFCLSHPWLVTWWEKVGSVDSRNQLCLFTMRENETLVAVAPLYLERNRVLGQTIKFLGSGSACSDIMSFPALHGFEESMAQSVLETLHQPEFVNQFGRVNLLELEGHFGDDSAVSELVHQSKLRGYELETRELEGCWRVPIPEDWEEFRKSIKKSQRRKINKVDRLAETDDFKTEYVESPARLREVWPAFVELHQKRRNQLGQTGCFADTDFDEFLALASQRLATDNRTLMTYVTYQGQPFGAILCFVSGDCLCVYQSGLNIEDQSFEPGHYANTMTCRLAQDRGLKALDFLRGDEPYKANWGCERTALYRTRLVAPTMSSQLRHWIFAGSRQVRDLTRDLVSWSISSFSRSEQGA